MSICAFLALIAVLFSYSAIAESPTGWSKQNGHFYFYDDSEILTGIQAIEGYLYTFNENGVLLGNGSIIDIENESYYIDSEGFIVTGWQSVDDNRYYFDTNSGCAIKMTVYEINGQKYVFNSKGQLQIRSWYKKNDLFYYGDENGHPLEGYQIIGENAFFFHSEGYSLNGLILVNDEYHYFDLIEFHPEAKGWRKIDGFWYFFGENTGVMQKNPTTIKGQTYYFGKDGKLGINGDMILYGSNQIIGVNSDGDLLSGFFVINGFTYYQGFFYDQAFNMHYSEMPHDFCDIPQNGKDYYYLFDELGRMHTGFIEQYGHLYYYSEDGVRQSGWQTINGKTYCFGRYTMHSYDTAYAYAGGTFRIEKDGEYAYYEFASDGALIPDLEGKARFELPDNISCIDSSAFENTDCEVVIIPEGCVSIESRAFANCKNLIYVRLPLTILTIADDAFIGSEQTIIDKR